MGFNQSSAPAAALGSVVARLVFEWELDTLLSCLADAGEEAPDRLLYWARRQTLKARGGLASLLQRLLSKVLRPKLAAAQAALKSAPGEGAEGVDFGKLASLCEDALRLDDLERRASASACRALHGVSRLPLAGPPSDYVVQDLDAILLLFQRAFIGQRAQSASKQLVQLCEFEADTGLPPVQDAFGTPGRTSEGSHPGDAVGPTGRSTDVSTGLGAARSYFTLHPCIPPLPPRGPARSAAPATTVPKDVTGTKTVQGRRVEGGEGHGLRKEFFTSMSLDAQRRWGRLTSSEGILEPGPVMCVGSRLKLQPLEAPSSELHQLLMAASNGDRIKLLFSSGHSIERTVTGNMPMPGGGSSIVVDAPFEEGT
ncbi:Uncharacterized protein SCF082_LOCUS4266 [Durusdinium trenchii]|uniref:Uncharacterized protein n=1 Tax=Durusdinium trenchii TaxID=1381693 RepID=A0ABP0HZY6_9DINO